MTLFMILASCYGLLQLAALGSLTRSVRVVTLLLAVPVGLYGCGAVTVLLQYVYTRGVAAVTGTPLGEVVRTASYTVDPVIEEVVKVAPLVVLALFVRRIGRRWGLTDYTLLGAALGAGFGLVEALMRWSHSAASATGSIFGGWTVHLGLAGYRIPGPFQIVGAWLPAPVSTVDLFGGTGDTTNHHLIYSAFAGFGVGLLIRGTGWLRLLGLVPGLYACAAHATFNFHVMRPDDDGLLRILVTPVDLLAHAMWFFPVLLLVAAGLLDWRRIRAGRLARPDVILPGEPAVLGRFATVGPPWTPFIAARFVLARRSLLYAGDDAALGEQVRAIRTGIEATNDPAAWRSLWSRDRGTAPTSLAFRPYWRPLLALALAVPAVVFLVLGGFPFTSGIQTLFANPFVFPVIGVVLLGGMAMVAWQLWLNVRALPATLRQPVGDQGVHLAFHTAVGAGALAVGSLSMLSWLRGGGADSPVVTNVHILDAISRTTTLLGFILMAFSLLVLFASMLPPGGLGLAVAGVGGRAGLSLVLQQAAAAGMRAGALGVLLGMIMSMAGGNTGRGPSRSDPDYWEDTYGDAEENQLPRRERVSDGNKTELQESGWLRQRVPDRGVREQFMKWLERGHQVGEEHVHLRPGSPEATQKLTEFFEEFPELVP